MRSLERRQRDSFFPTIVTFRRFSISNRTLFGGHKMTSAMLIIKPIVQQRQSSCFKNVPRGPQIRLTCNTMEHPAKSSLKMLISQKLPPQSQKFSRVIFRTGFKISKITFISNLKVLSQFSYRFKFSAKSQTKLCLHSDYQKNLGKP